ncbi:unnamed protein product, partial [Staurois parvus]
MGPPTDPGTSGSARVSKWSVRPCQNVFCDICLVKIIIITEFVFFLNVSFIFYYIFLFFFFIFQHTVTKAIQCYHSNTELLW